MHLSWEDACSDELLSTIKAHAQAIGAPNEYIYFPF